VNVTPKEIPAHFFFVCFLKKPFFRENSLVANEKALVNKIVAVYFTPGIGQGGYSF